MAVSSGSSNCSKSKKSSGTRNKRKRSIVDQQCFLPPTITIDTLTVGLTLEAAPMETVVEAKVIIRNSHSSATRKEKQNGDCHYSP